jgi:signal transduction histidine kinase
LVDPDYHPLPMTDVAPTQGGSVALVTIVKGVGAPQFAPTGSQQVLMNLMLNGIEAMKETGGVLTMKSQLGEDGEIQVSIHDTGPGLPPGKADQIFDAFFTTKPRGSGMGLAISKSIVESHGGRIWANGDGGRGATFHFTLPTEVMEPSPLVT